MGRFVILDNNSRAFGRLPRPLPEVNTIDDLMALQERVECDIRIQKPDGSGKRLIELVDP